jgi:hypothetical protein
VRLFLLLILFGTFSWASGQNTALKKNTSEILIQWQDTLPGDFAFSDQWSYTDGILKDANNVFQCVYNCHPRIENMYSIAREIKPDSLPAFYSLIDTTHYDHTFQGNVSSYEFDKTHFITCIKNEAGFINCFTNTNKTNHSNLRFSLINNKCLPTVQLSSSDKNLGFKIFKLQSGKILIDRSAFSQGVLKAKFDFTFINTIDPKKPITWKGELLSPINEF